MAQAFGGVGSEVVDVVEPPLGQDAIDRRVIGNAALDETGATRHVVGKASTEVVEDSDVEAARKQRLGDMGANEPGSAGHEYASHHVRGNRLSPG